MVNKEANVFLYDIEISPNIGYTWGKYEQNVIEFLRERMMISVAWKWLGDPKIHSVILPDFPFYKRNPTDNKALVKKFYLEYCKADVVIAHNEHGFDGKELRTNFIKKGLRPPPPMKVVDTLQIARNRFRFNSNRLDDLGHVLGLGRKVKHPGFALWLGCLDGNMKSWKLMRKYNIGDVKLLEKVYLKLRSWDERHPDLSNFSGTWSCPACGSFRCNIGGYRYNIASVKQKLRCKDCSKWYTGPTIGRRKIYPPSNFRVKKEIK